MKKVILTLALVAAGLLGALRAAQPAHTASASCCNGGACCDGSACCGGK